MSVVAAPQREVGAQLLQVDGLGLQPGGVVLRQLGKCLSTPRAERKHRGARLGLFVHRELCGRGLFQHHVRVRATETEGVDARDGPVEILRPGARARRHLHAPAVKVDLGVGRLEVQVSGDLPLVDAQHGLDQARDTRTGFEVTDVGLDRPDEGNPVGLALVAEHPAQRVGLDGVAHRRPRTVRLHVTDVLRRDPGAGQGRTEVGFLRGAAGHRDPLCPAVLVHRRTPDHGVDAIAIQQCLAQRLQQNDAGTLATHVAVGRRVESLRAAVWRQHGRLAQGNGELRCQHQVDTAGQRQVALAVLQALAGQVDGRQRRRAGGIDRHARPAQVERVGQPVGDDAHEGAGGRVRAQALDLGGLPLERTVILAAAAHEDTGPAAR